MMNTITHSIPIDAFLEWLRLNASSMKVTLRIPYLQQKFGSNDISACTLSLRYLISHGQYQAVLIHQLTDKFRYVSQFNTNELTMMKNVLCAQIVDENLCFLTSDTAKDAYSYDQDGHYIDPPKDYDFISPTIFFS
ncbi:hypothetical protein N9R79_09225 [Vibrio sp.]|nr:hypothetical protein [Vibrio sp.]